MAVKVHLPTRLVLSVVLAVAMLATLATAAQAGTRSLKLYFTHTKESLTVVYKRNGRYDPKGIRDLNRFFRDWRRNESTKMDPELFDLLWEVQQEFGGKTLHIVSAYRSPATNSMLRRRSRGVARNSKHMAGKAIDFFIPGANMSKVRAAGMKRQVGGVGYYPRSSSAFVHFDTGRVRSWPRMSQRELSRLFPDGKTLHLPSNGKPLSGYKEAQRLEKQGKLARLDGGSSFGVGSLFAFAGGSGRSNGSAAVGDDPGSLLRPASVSATRVAEAPKTAEPPKSRVVAANVVSREEKEPKKKTPKPESAVEVRTAALGPATTVSGEDGGLFRQLPSVSLGGLIGRFSRDDKGDADGPARVEPVAVPDTPLTAVASPEASPATETSAAQSEGPNVPIPTPRPALAAASPSEADGEDASDPVAPEGPAEATSEGVPDEEPAQTPAADEASPVLVAALPPQRPGASLSDPAVPAALSYARATDGAEPDTPLGAVAALIDSSPAPESPRVVGTKAAAVPSPTPPVPAAEAADRRVVPAALEPVRGASPALIAETQSISSDGLSDLTPRNETGASGKGLLMAGDFLGAPSGFASAAAWPSTNSFSGLTITVYAPSRSGS